MIIKNAAKNYLTNWVYSNVTEPVLDRDISDAFIAGARFERDRILGMLRSPESAEVDYFHKPVGLSPDEWADWIENELKKES